MYSFTFFFFLTWKSLTAHKMARTDSLKITMRLVQMVTNRKDKDSLDDLPRIALVNTFNLIQKASG